MTKLTRKNPPRKSTKKSPAKPQKRTRAKKRPVESEMSPASNKDAAPFKLYLKEFNYIEERKRPRLLSILFCDLINITKEDKVNLIGIFDRIFVHPERKQTPLFSLFVRAAELADEPSYITVFKPDGTAVTGVVFGTEKVDFTPNLPAQIQFMAGFQFIAETEGVYWFDISYKGVSIGGAGLTVQYRETEDRQGGTDTFV